MDSSAILLAQQGIKAAEGSLKLPLVSLERDEQEAVSHVEISLSQLVPAGVVV